MSRSWRRRRSRGGGGDGQGTMRRARLTRAFEGRMAGLGARGLGGENTNANVRLLGTARSVARDLGVGSGARGVAIAGVGAHLHDGGAVVGDGGDALIVVDELIETARTLRADRGREGGGEAVSAEEIQKGRGGRSTEAHRDLGRGSGARRTRVVRMESTTAMHALMFEISWPLPWLVSVPSRRSTIWGCCGRLREGGRAARRQSDRAFENKDGIAEGRSRAPQRRSRGGTPRRGTHDHLPVGHLHERTRHGASPRWRTMDASAVRTRILSG
jgi:hypothetical protein